MLFVYAYTLVIFFLIFNIVQDARRKEVNFNTIIVAIIITSLLAGWIGAGPGYMLIPVLVTSGMELKKSIAVSLFVEVLSSLTGLQPHLITPNRGTTLVIVLVLIGSVFTYLGAKLFRNFPLGKKSKLTIALVLLSISIYAWMDILGNCINS